MSHTRRIVRVLGVLAIGLLLATCGDDDSTSPTCHVTITSPNGGEVWTAGETHTISWSSDGPCNCALDIELLRDGEVCAVIAEGIANSGEYEWASQTCGEDTTGYQIRITLGAACANRSDVSDATFTISTSQGPQCALTLTAPAGGERYPAGEAVSIAWDASAACGELVQIELLLDGANCQTISAETENDGAYTWTAAACAADTSGYGIRITDLDSGVSDETAGTFDITGTPAPCTITLIAPNGGETLLVGEASSIQWSTSGVCGETVQIELLHDGEVCLTIAAETENDLAYQWIPALCNEEIDGYQVRITEPTSGATDLSASTFEIREPVNPELCTLTVTQPTYQEQLTAGELYTILWESAGTCGDWVKIDLYRLGVLCMTLSDSTQNDESFDWLIDCCGGSPCGYTVRITDLTSGAHDSSDDFGIDVVCELEVIAPNGGERYYVGDQIPITWNGDHCGSEVKIELLQDGVACRTLARETNNDGDFAWYGAAQCDGPDGYTIRITDPDTETVDESDGPFQILVPCELTITSPPGGGTWELETTLPIEWGTSGDDCGDEVMIELIRGDEVCLVISEATPNDGAFDWTTEQCAGFTSGYIIRVTDTTSGAFDVTDGSLEILFIPPPTCEIELLAPNGGEALCVGEPFEIIWTPNEFCGAEVIIELLRDGEVCETISAATENDGALLWDPAQCDGQSDNYTIRITDLGTTVSVESAATFQIFPACVLTVSSPMGGETLCAGEVLMIEWTASACCGDEVRIDLLRGGEVCLTIAEATDNNGSLAWEAAQCPGGTGDYSIRVTDLETGVSAESPASFSIDPPCAIEIGSPQGGELICVGGDLVLIEWASSNCCGSLVTIELLLDGVVCRTIAESAPNSGSFAWNPEQCGDATEGYTIRITDELSGAIGEMSATFGIAPACTVVLTAPEGGEAFCLGEPIEILWTHSACCGNEVRLELLLDGVVCLTIAAATENDGSLIWNPVQCDGATGDYTIRVTDLDTGSTDETTLGFQIFPECVITVEEPNGEESVCVGGEFDILWTPSSCCGDQVKIELLHDGAVCATIAAATANDGSYPWSPAQCDGATDGYAVRITDLETGAFDESDLTFAINPPCAITVTAPDAEAEFCEGDAVSITWTSSTCCGDYVKIELITAGGGWATIAASTPNDGAHSWDAQQSGGYDEGYTIRVTDLSTGAWGESEASFTILAACHVVLDSPRHGDLYCVGDPVEIVWDPGSACCGDRVKIELFRYGALITTFASSTVNDGLHTWPSAQQHNGYPHGYAIRVTNLATGAANGIDWAFTIGEGDANVIFPNGGEEFCGGEALTIRWSRTNCFGNTVKLELLNNGSLCKTIAAATSNDGDYNWAAVQCGSAESGYAIRITDLESGAVDVSDDVFSIYPPCAIEITSPSSGEVLTVGESVPISWEFEACCGPNVTIELLHDGTVCEVIAADTPNDGDHDWIAAQCGSWTEDYEICVTDIDTGAFDCIDVSFLPPCELEVDDLTCEYLCAGADVTITWTATGCGETVTIELLQKGSSCLTIDGNAPNTGSYLWKPIEQCGVETEDYQFMVTDNDSGVSDANDTAFGINPPCELGVVWPNGGEVLCAGTPYVIEWDYSTCCGTSVVIELLQDDAVCLTIAGSTDNDGEYQWAAEQCSGVENYMVRISDPKSGAEDTSDATFSIEPLCELTVTSPIEGDEYAVGETVEITWTSNSEACCGEEVKIELYQDGAFCNELAAATENDGAFEWPAAQCDGSEGYTVKITDLQSGAEGESGIFRIIDSCTVRVLWPNTGERLCVEQEYELRWDASGACGDQVMLELTRFDQPCIEISGSTPNDGSFLWTAEMCAPFFWENIEPEEATTGYRLRVTDLTTGAVDNSDLSFKIDPACQLIIIDPNGGEVYTVGETIELTWWKTFSSCCGDFVRVELWRDGALCRVLAASTPNDLSFEWIAEQCDGESEGYQVHISDPESGSEDFSDGPFTIEPAAGECTIEVIYPSDGTVVCFYEMETITWDAAAGCGDYVKIELFEDGTYCATITESAPNTGNYDWFAAPCGAAGSEATFMIRITDLDSSVSDDSGDFTGTYVPCLADIFSPVGGETYCIGETMTISWTVSDCCGEFARLVLVCEDDVECRVIAESTPSGGSFEWEVAVCDDPPLACASYRIGIYDLKTGKYTETEGFTIADCPGQ
ncbi:MAG: hypothetical protein KAY32_07990 [Candidatus Eisenbacteria sp.]|nr:hypothetical protein [Candidatus Eisenbacteria bacterium]